MKRSIDTNSLFRPVENNRPHASLGVGCLTSMLWKAGSSPDDEHYRFNLFRMTSNTGEVTQLFQPENMKDLLKLLRSLSIMLVNEGCLEPNTDADLIDLVSSLEIGLDGPAAFRQAQMNTLHRNALADILGTMQDHRLFDSGDDRKMQKKTDLLLRWLECSSNKPPIAGDRP